MITQILSGENDKDWYSTVIGTADKPTLIASLLECDSLIKTQQLGDPEWEEHFYKGKDDKKGAAGKDDSGKSHWVKVTKAEIKNLKLVDSGKKKHPCVGSWRAPNTIGRPGGADANSSVSLTASIP